MNLDTRQYSLLEPGNSHQYIRASMLSTFDFCPLCFKKTLIEGQERIISSDMQYGTEFHAAMDKYFDGILDLSKLEDPVLTWVQWTIQLEKRRAKRPGYYPPVAREIHLKAPDLLLEGHVDRIDRTVEGHEILDYKTGRSFYKDAVQLQLAFYAILWEHITGTNVSKLVMLNPRRKQIEVWDFEESLIKRVAYKVAKIRHAIETDTFPAKCTVAKWLVCGLCDIEEVI